MSWQMKIAGVCLLVITQAAGAGLTVAVDYDGTAGNGPDTAYVGYGDTISVNLWFLGPDSLNAFGLTVNDYSELLKWVAEPGDSIYDVPGGWAIVEPVPNDDSSGVTLQAVDFTLVGAIHPNIQIGRLLFYVAVPGVCTPIVVDLDNSGWFEASAGGQEFTGSTNLRVCGESPGTSDSLSTWGGLREARR